MEQQEEASGALAVCLEHLDAALDAIFSDALEEALLGDALDLQAPLVELLAGAVGPAQVAFFRWALYREPYREEPLHNTVPQHTAGPR